MNKSKQKIILVAIILAIGVASDVIYLKKTEVTTVKNIKQNAAQVENNAQNILDCSTKVVQNKSSVMSKADKTSDRNCLFLGCGDFF